jgi:hypothetical protein
MPEPIRNNVSYNDFSYYDPDTDHTRETILSRLDQRTYGACARPEGILSSVVCGDDTAVSNACRTAKPGSAAAYVCNDKNLKAAQEEVERSTWDVLKNIIASALFGRVNE